MTRADEMPMRCREALARSSEALDSRLGLVDARRFRAHLLSCPSCRDRFERLRALQRLTRNLPGARLTSGFRARLDERIASGEGSPPLDLALPLHGRGRLPLFVSGALTAATLAIAFWLVIDGIAARPESTMQVPERRRAVVPVIASPFPVGPATLAERALQHSSSVLESLQRERRQWLAMPPRHSYRKIVDRLRDVYQGISIVRALSPEIVEFSPEAETRVRLLERTLRPYVDDARASGVSRDDIRRLLAELGKLGPADELRTQCRLRIPDGGFDLAQRLGARLGSPKRLVELSEFMTRILGTDQDRGHGPGIKVFIVPR